MELVPETEVTLAPPTGCWDWVRDHLNLDGYTTTLGHRWDGQFTAPCPCGRLVSWNAHLRSPLCVCQERSASSAKSSPVPGP